MTYLYQLRAYFTGHELEVQQIGKTSDESSYMIGRFNTDTDTDVTHQLFGQEIINLRKAKQNQSNATEENKHAEPPAINKPPPLNLRLSLALGQDNSETKEQSKLSPTSAKDVKDIILSSSKNILGKVLSPTKDKLVQNNLNKKTEKIDKSEKVDKKPALMTRRELTDPFGSDDEDTPEKEIKDDEDVETTDNKFCDNNELNQKDPASPKLQPVSFFPCYFFLYLSRFCSRSR